MPTLSRLWDYLKSPGPMALIAIGGILFGVYQTFYYERKGDMEITIEAATRVFDVYRPVGDLEISYRGENLRLSQKALWAISLTIKNPGNAEIKKIDFDDSIPFGIFIRNGEIVDRPLLKSTNEYLRKQTQLKVAKDSLTLSPVIFEPGDAVQIEFLTLVSDKTRPLLGATGKIAGVKTIKIITAQEKNTEKPFIYKVFDTKELSVHATRAIAYLLAGFLSLISLVITIFLITKPISIYHGFIGRKKAREILSHIGSSTPSPEAIFARQIFSRFGPRGLGALSGVINTIISDYEKFKDVKTISKEQLLQSLLSRESGVRLKILNLLLENKNFFKIEEERLVFSSLLLEEAEQLSNLAGTHFDANGIKRRITALNETQEN